MFHQVLNKFSMSLVCIVLTFVSVTVHAADEPEIIYQKAHKAILDFQPPALIQLLSTPRKQQLKTDRNAEARLAANIVALNLPNTYSISAKTPGTDGQSMRLLATGEAVDGYGRKTQANGTIDLVREDTGWKIQNIVWGLDKLFD